MEIPLNKNHLAELKIRNNSNNKIQQSNYNLNITQKKSPKKNKNSQNSESISNQQESQFNLFSQSGGLPDIVICKICHEMLPESEKRDHMYSHDLQSKENKVPHNDEFRKTQNQNEVDNQKEIEKLIKRENEERRQQQNLLNHKRRRNESIIGNIKNNRSKNNHVNNMNNISDNNNSNRINPIRGGGMELKKIEKRGPMIGPLSNTIINEAIIININCKGSNFNVNIHDILEELIRMSGIRKNSAHQENLIELQETKINDVNRLDSDKKKCVICLEDFKKGDKATTLPCIHLFHTTCIGNWLETKNYCPLCKFELTEQNINSQS